MNVWIPSISFWSFLQSHPFPIASWEAKDGVTSLDLLVDPRNGLTQKLYTCAEYYRERPSKGTDRILDEHPRTVIRWLRSRDDLCESVEQGFKSTAVDCHKSHETLSESMEEGVENIQPTKFGYERYEGEPQRSDFRLAVISGPHGMGIPVGDHGKVLMIATGFGIVAQIPYLKQLVWGLNRHQVRTREIRLIWQLQSFGSSIDPYR